jgi:hypothetical protein
MSAWHKALKNMNRLQVIEVTVECKCGCAFIDESMGSAMPGAGFCATLPEACQRIRKAGWTYTKDGEWLCPKCSKEGESC